MLRQQERQGRFERGGLSGAWPAFLNSDVTDRPHQGARGEHLGDRRILREGPHIVVGGLGQDLERRPDLGEGPVAHDGDPVGQPQCLGEVVGDEHDGALQLDLQRHQLVLHVAPDERVERRERLVEEQHLGLHGQGTCQPDPLLHAAAELLGVVVAPAVEPHGGEHLARPLVALVTRNALHLQPVRHVVDHAPVGEQAEVLEDHRHLAAAQLAQCRVAGVGQDGSAHFHVAERGLDQARHAAHQRGLARARQAHHHERLAGMHVEGDIADRHQAVGLGLDLLPVGAFGSQLAGSVDLLAEDLPQTADRDDRLHGCPHCPRVPRYRLLGRVWRVDTLC